MVLRPQYRDNFYQGWNVCALQYRVRTVFCVSLVLHFEYFWYHVICLDFIFDVIILIC